VMYAGKIVESGPVKEIFYRAKHPYTWGLLKSVPKLNQMKKEKLYSIDGQPPDLIKPPQGCAFAPRCEYAMQVCQQYQPEVTTAGPDHQVACWLEHPQAQAVKGGN